MLGQQQAQLLVFTFTSCMSSGTGYVITRTLHFNAGLAFLNLPYLDSTELKSMAQVLLVWTSSSLSRTEGVHPQDPVKSLNMEVDGSMSNQEGEMNLYFQNPGVAPNRILWLSYQEDVLSNEQGKSVPIDDPSCRHRIRVGKQSRPLFLLV